MQKNDLFRILANGNEHLAFGKTNYHCSILGHTKFPQRVLSLWPFKTEMAGNRNAGYGTKLWELCRCLIIWIGVHLVMGVAECKHLNTNEGYKLDVESVSKQRPPCLHFVKPHLWQTVWLIQSCVLCPSQETRLSAFIFKEASHILNRATACIMNVFISQCKIKSISHSVLHVIMMFRAH